MKIICLGNEFIKEDSLAKQVGEKLEKEGYEVVNIKDSFELMEILNKQEDKSIILDVVEGLEEPRHLKLNDLKQSQMITAHDFDAGFVLGLLGANLDILGIPQRGNVENVANRIKTMISRT